MPKILELPIVPLRGMTLFPNSLAPITVGRPSSLRAIEALGADKMVAVVAQRDPRQDEPGLRELHAIGTAGVVLRVNRRSEERAAAIVFVEGAHRVRLLEELQRQPFTRARCEVLDDLQPATEDAEFSALDRTVRELFAEIVEGSTGMPSELLSVARNIDDAGALTDFVASSLPTLSAEERQELLETLDVRVRLRRLAEELVRERQDQQLRDRIRAEVQEKIAERQKEYLLREQLRVLRKELGEEEEPEEEVEDLRQQLDQAGLPPEARREADRELVRLERIPAGSPEYSVARTYLDWLSGLPWQVSSEGAIDIRRAERILDEDHYGLEKIKERILEYLAVYQLKRDLKGPILCFVGPPGVGKTSLGRSIARSMGREFVRISLGGMSDEAEIRGHRRTYIGALPGQIIRSIRRAGANDPVFMLDEVDKLGRDFRGDPSAALLEVLDPEQNHAFRDRYLDVAFDLSRVLFIGTANILDPIPSALLDRMEVIELSGYVDEEKLEIARRYLAPKQVRANGLTLSRDIDFTDDGLREMIHSYTREAGVRLLEQKLASVCRKRAKRLIEEGGGTFTVTPEVVRQMLGAPRYRIETEIAERTRTAGVAVALAWTPAGGEVLFVEASRMPRDRGEFTITGQVRQVMEESARAALSWLRANAARLGIEPRTFADYDVHIHVPAGAVPKDGPSAGSVMATALTSLFAQRPVRPYVAMTGEITLSGLVLPVGGIKEKVVGARRSGIREVILPEENRSQVFEEVPERLREGLVLHFARTLDDALVRAFGRPLGAIGRPDDGGRGDYASRPEPSPQPAVEARGNRR